jgi:hypothetical protein
MFERNVSGDVVARSFLLAETLRKAPPDRDSFRALLEEERKKIAALSIKDLFAQIDADRRKRFEMGQWVFTIINLERCAVWPGMGGEAWAKGPVHKISGLFPSKAMPGNKTRAMRERILEIYAEFPLILIRTRSDHSRMRIEDGSHRAIAYFLAGFKQAFAYVARVPSSCNLTWKWEG